MSEHTPGPWRLEVAEHIQGTRIYADKWLPIATVNLRKGNADEDAANARLIAASPELLAALKALTEGPYTPQTFSEAMGAARAAIARAEGKEPR